MFNIYLKYWIGLKVKNEKCIIFSYSNIDDIHNMIDDIAVFQDLNQGISQAFCNPIRSETDEDEVRKIIFSMSLNI